LRRLAVRGPFDLSVAELTNIAALNLNGFSLTPSKLH
jgi:hypothetical protein